MKNTERRGAAAFISASEEQPKQEIKNISVPADEALRDFLKDIAWYRQVTQKELILQILNEYKDANNDEYMKIVNFKNKRKK